MPKPRPAKKVTIGRRVGTTADLERGGDYCGPIPDANGTPRIWLLLPNARDDDAPPTCRSRISVTAPPWTFRECGDGSVDVRASIGLRRREALDGPGSRFVWHGFLDCGHRWREV